MMAFCLEHDQNNIYCNECLDEIINAKLRAVRDALLALDSTDIPGTGIEVIYERDIEALFRRGGPFEVKDG